MSNAYDLKDAVTELTAALKPLGLLSESLRGLDKSHKVQADMQVVEHYYTEGERRAIYAEIALAIATDEDATSTLLISSKRGSDQRTFDQYAAAHGKAEAERAFTTHDDAVAGVEAAQQRLNELKRKHPVLYRLQTYVSNG